MKRSQDRDVSPRIKRSRSEYLGPEHDFIRDRYSSERERSRTRMKDTFFEDEMDRQRAKYKDDRYDDYPPAMPRTETRNPEYRSLCVSGVSSKVPDRILKDQMYREFEKYGEMNVNITFSGDQRVVYINFKYPEDARAAKHDKYNKLIVFDRPVRIESVYNKIRSSSPPPYREQFSSGRGDYPTPGPPMGRGYPGPPGPPLPGPGRDFHGPPPPFRGDFHGGPPLHHDDHAFPPHNQEGGFVPKRAPGSEKFPYHLDHKPPEEDANATRTLFIGNLDYNISEQEIRSIFEAFGPIDEIDIKRPQRGQGNAYAFMKYYNLDMAHRAKVEMSGKYIGRFQCKIGYGKIIPSSCIWVGGLGPWVTPQALEAEFDRFGVILKIDWPHGKNYAYVVYENGDAAQAALNEMRGFPLGGKDKRIRVDFADPTHIGQQINDAPPPKRNYGQPMDGARYSDGPPRDGYSGPPREPFPGGDRDEWAREGNGYRPGDRPRPGYEDFRPSPGDKRMSRSPGRDYYDRRRDDYSPQRRRSRSPEDMSPLENIHSLSDLSKRLPVAWNGALVLKSSAFPARMHVVSGNVQIVDRLMRDPTTTETPALTIKQRLRLDPSKTDDVAKRVLQAGPRNHCVLIAFPSSLENYDDPARNIQQRPLKNLVSYLKQKEAAGVISLPPYPTKDKDNVGLLHAFPPCQFGYEYLLRRAPSCQQIACDDYIVVVVVRGAA
ncbi:LOW QUALITY PROTEIN: putative RNA-binding protein 15B [Mya arenaria]|uniref:LOW QUALITY PROTEIN: putative RNA-binding protein 15B n=1 Tax=Mya arenaria TaxID=6604 RepID=UPI0022E3F8BD|nr:LOW QUALITY PROTEIN: putative RNA-binding protein 15B [Mya arenaria]